MLTVPVVFARSRSFYLPMENWLLGATGYDLWQLLTIQPPFSLTGGKRADSKLDVDYRTAFLGAKTGLSAYLAGPTRAL